MQWATGLKVTMAHGSWLTFGWVILTSQMSHHSSVSKSLRKSIHGMENESWAEWALKRGVEGIIGGISSDEGNWATAALASGAVAGAAMAPAAAAIGGSFASSLIPPNIGEDIPPLSEIMDKVGPNLYMASLREDLKDQKQAEFERKETLRINKLMAHHKQMAREYQRGGGGFNKQSYHLYKARQAHQRRRKFFYKPNYNRTSFLRTYGNQQRFERQKRMNVYYQERAYQRGRYRGRGF